MAGPVRQPIDLKALEKYIDKNVPEIKTPLDLKQVRTASGSPYNPVTDSLVVRVWPVKPYLPNHFSRWQAICAAKETAGQASLQNGTPGRPRIQDHTRTRRH